MSENADKIAYNDDELVPPGWLDTTFLTDVLSNHEKAPGLRVTDLSFSPACQKGEHYASIMFRAKVKYSTEKGDFEKSLIIKAMPEVEGHKKDLIGSSPLFETEVGMYSKVLPEFERILREAGDSTKLCVDCIYHSLEPRKVLIFEDLNEMGYSVLRDRQATDEEVCPAYYKLAKWHAVSLKVQDEQPHFLEKYTNGLFEMPQFMEEPFMKTGMQYFVDLLSNDPELNKYRSYFEKIKPDFLERLTAEWKDLRNSPNVERVLCHGDLHLRNMMFQNTKDSLKDCMLLDFQISHLFPLTIDLVYSIYMLMKPEHRWKHWDEYIDYYFFVLTNTLEKIGYKGEIPISEGLVERTLRHKFYEFFLISTFLPLMWALRETSVDFGDLLQDHERRRKCYFSEGYIKDVKIMLARLDLFGYFEEV